MRLKPRVEWRELPLARPDRNLICDESRLRTVARNRVRYGASTWLTHMGSLIEKATACMPLDRRCKPISRPIR